MGFRGGKIKNTGTKVRKRFAIVIMIELTCECFVDDVVDLAELGVGTVLEGQLAAVLRVEDAQQEVLPPPLPTTPQYTQTLRCQLD